MERSKFPVSVLSGCDSASVVGLSRAAGRWSSGSDGGTLTSSDRFRTFVLCIAVWAVPSIHKNGKQTHRDNVCVAGGEGL